MVHVDTCSSYSTSTSTVLVLVVVESSFRVHSSTIISLYSYCHDDVGTKQILIDVPALIRTKQEPSISSKIF